LHIAEGQEVEYPVFVSEPLIALEILNQREVISFVFIQHRDVPLTERLPHDEHVLSVEDTHCGLGARKVCVGLRIADVEAEDCFVPVDGCACSRVCQNGWCVSYKRATGVHQEHTASMGNE
jgi:hypothetical protein